ncbi:MAG: chromosomal replication initiator protein DnaA [Eubacteriales bacterium]|nr:chromosomal replication initiator protein DnaA [Eubacteriales bacterium]
MNTIEANQKWEEVLGLLREEITGFNYDTWIAPIVLMEVEDGVVRLEVSDMFIRSNLKKRYERFILQAVQTVFGPEYEAEFLSPGMKPEDTGRKTPARTNTGFNLNPRYTFDTFVVGSNNRFAAASASAVAEMPAVAYNPLFLYGGVGLGKTHLMHAIGHEILRQDPDANLLYMTSEEFTNEVISSISKRKNEELRDKLRNVDVLMVDDIQFIAGKTATQEEFFHTFNQLHSMKKQIVISSDRPPQEIPTLEERLRSRFQMGLVADIQRPDYETRIAILNRKAEEEHYQFDDEVIAFIAENIKSNIRELEGAMNRVNAFADLNRSPVTMELAREALGDLIPIRDPKRVTAELIMQVVCDHCGVTIEDMTSSRRSREISEPRQIAMYLCRELVKLSTTRIGAAFGKRDHTTVMHACEKVSKDAAKSPEVRKTIETLKQKIKEA